MHYYTSMSVPYPSFYAIIIITNHGLYYLLLTSSLLMSVHDIITCINEPAKQAEHD